MSKLRTGQTVTVGERKYKVTRVDGAYRRCRICQENNKCLPCTNPDPTIENATVGSVWNQRMCNEQLPKDAYLKPCTNLNK